MKSINYNGKEIKLPLDLDYTGKPLEMVKVSNIFSGESTHIPQFAVSVYDFINGCQMTQRYDNFEKALNWFRVHFPKDYMILLD